MKTLVQVLAGVIVGALLAILLPTSSIILVFITELSTTIISIGRYLVLPLLFFTLIVSTCQLQRNKNLFKSFIKALGISAAFTLLMVIIGIVASLVFSTGQIPVVIDGIQNISVPTFKDLLRSSFPSNLFSVFQGNFDSEHSQFVPFFVMAIILGYFFTKSSREEVEPTFNLVDSLSRVFYKINQYFLKISFIWVTILSCAYTTVIKNILDINIFLPLALLLLFLTLFIILIVYPIIFYFTCGKRNMFLYILKEFPSLLLAAISGDQFMVGTILIPSQKNNFYIKRENSGFNIPFLTLFSKSGTALVTVITFIVILKSYSSLEITASQILWVGIFSFLISFCLPTKAVGGTIASLFLMCSLYGYGGMEDSFIILAPAFPIIGGISTILNTATIILINIIIDPQKQTLLQKKK